MKILVIGAGAVGGYYGGRLAQAGHDLYFVARGEQLQAITQNGLQVSSIQGDFTIQPKAQKSFEPIPDLGLILVCVKRKDTVGILDTLKAQTGAGTIAITLQNGVDTEKALMDAVPPERIVGGIAFLGAELTAPGRIRHTASGKITIGELDGSQSPRLAELQKLFEGAQIPCSISADIVKAKWEKLLWNVGFNGICAIAGLSTHKVVQHPGKREIVRRLMEEHIQVAQGLGIKINPALVDKYLDNAANGGDVVPSTLQDVRKGKATEIDYMNGKVVEEGRKLGIPVPYNETIWVSVSAI